VSYELVMITFDLVDFSCLVAWLISCKRGQTHILVTQKVEKTYTSM
jgi:hypothetical protein